MLLNISAMRNLQNSNQLISRVWFTSQCKIKKHASLEVFLDLKQPY